MKISPENLPINLHFAHQCIMNQQQQIHDQSDKIGQYQSQVDQQQRQLTDYESKVLHYQQQIDLLQEQLKLAIAKQFGRSSEKLIDPDDPQGKLFDEDELLPTNDQEDPPEVTEQQVAAHTRQTNRGKRQSLPAYLERVRIEYKLPEHELIGDNGEVYTKIGESISEQLDIIPAQVKVLQHVRYKYAVRTREELGVKIAPITNQSIPKSIASSGLLAHIAQSKYCHHMPLYRQEKIWASLDVNMPRNSMCRWMMQIGALVKPLVKTQFALMKQHQHIHVDETKVLVLKDKHKLTNKKAHQGYMWVYVNKFGTLYDYRPGRHGEHPRELLSDYKGFIQTDGYAGYNGLFDSKDRLSVGCMAHARRKFVDVQKASGKHRDGIATRTINLIAKLYKLERRAKQQGFNEQAIGVMRKTEAIPILEKIHAYITEKQPTVPPKSGLGKAIAYMLNHWQALRRYTESGMVNIDNNPAERAIRPFAVGRKNWLFCGNERGAEAAANIYSLIESAKYYNLKLFEYLKYIFEQLPEVTDNEQLEKLLPVNAQHYLPTIKVGRS